MSERPLLPLQPPQQTGALTASDLMPFASRKVSLWRSRAFLPIVLMTGTCLYLFSLNSAIQTTADVKFYMNIVATFALVVVFLLIYSYSGERKNALWYLVPAVLTAAQMMFLLGPYIHFFRVVLPGDATNATTFGSAFLASFIGAGLMEEVLKAVPILFGLAIALYVRANPASSNPLTRGLAVQGPLDGLMMGVAAGGAFILLETMLQYVPGEIAKYKDAGLGHLMGFTLLIPRIIKSIAGHMGYAAISGYFIGLAATHPKAAWKLVPIGILISSVLHGFWNSSSYLSPEYGLYIAGSLIAFMFLACLMRRASSRRPAPATPSTAGPSSPCRPATGRGSKASHTHPSRPPGSSRLRPPGSRAPWPEPRPRSKRSIGLTARTTVPMPRAEEPAAAVVPATGLSIGTASARYALAPNQPIDLSALFAADGVPPGYAGTIVGGPAGEMDIRNTGSASWVVTHADGTSIPVLAGQQFGAIAGTRLSLGPAVIDIAAY